MTSIIKQIKRHVHISKQCMHGVRESLTATAQAASRAASNLQPPAVTEPWLRDVLGQSRRGQCYESVVDARHPLAVIR